MVLGFRLINRPEYVGCISVDLFVRFDLKLRLLNRTLTLPYWLLFSAWPCPSWRTGTSFRYLERELMESMNRLISAAHYTLRLKTRYAKVFCNFADSLITVLFLGFFSCCVCRVRLLVNRQSGEAVAVKVIDTSQAKECADSVRKEVCVHKVCQL